MGLNIQFDSVNYGLIFIQTLTSNDSFSFYVNDTNISFLKKWHVPNASWIFVVIGSIMIVLGIAFFCGRMALFKGKGWIWVVTIILTSITLVFSCIERM
jgi:hypothetical protein